MIFLFFTTIVLVALILLWNLSLKLRITIKNKQNHFFVYIHQFWGPIKRKLDFSFALPRKGIISLLFGEKDLDMEHRYNFEDIKHLLIEQTINYKKSGTQLKNLWTKATLEKLYVDIWIGLDDAALTAIICGLTQSLTGGLYGLLNKDLDPENIRVKVFPDFDKRILEMDLDCIIRIKLGHIIITRIGIILRNIKGGDIIGRTPHRKYNDYHYGKY